MTVQLPLDQMTAQEKLQLIDILWESLEQHAEDIPVPEWHREILREREAAFDANDPPSIPLDVFAARWKDRQK